MVQFVLPFCSAVPHEHPETPISGCATIVDVSNVSLMRFWQLKGHMQRASVLATARYAETLGAIYLVGAPSFFATVWSWIKNWFDPGTVEKINILPASTQLRDLEQRIPRSSIPAKYGGDLQWAYGAPGPLLDEDARETLGAREGEDLGALLSAPVRWRDGKIELKGTGRGEAELARWKDGGRGVANGDAQV
ncbi:cytosolic factor, phosphatidylinositol/phosphatidylcholine transfer protein [Rhodotorula kratochvilovae]